MKPKLVINRMVSVGGSNRADKQCDPEAMVEIPLLSAIGI